MPFMRSPRFSTAALLAVLLSAVLGGVFGSSVVSSQDEVSQQYRVFTAALAAIDREYVEKVPSDRLVYGAIDGHAEDARSALELLRSEAVRADARAAGRQLLRPRHHHPVDRRRHHGDVDLRGLAGLQAGLRRGDVIARIEGEDAKGWTTEQAVKKLKGPKGTSVEHLAPPPRRRRSDQHGRRARRGEHHHRPRRVHDRQGNRLRQAGRVLRDLGSRARRRARAAQPPRA